jgi:hypothetical protein
VHIITYTCEQCYANRTSEAGIHSDGICASCGAPMRIDALFSDRRSVTLPVPFDRRELAGGNAA